MKNREESMMGAVRKIFDLLSKRERKMIYWLLPAITLMALMQVVGIASVLPFLTLVADPGKIETSETLNWLYRTLNFSQPTRFLIFTGFLSLGILVFGNAFSALTDWLLMRFSWRLYFSLSSRVLTNYLYKPYAFFLNENTSVLVKNIVAEVRQVIQGLVVAGMQLISRSIVALFILVLLILANPMLALTSFLVLGGAYGLVFALVRKRLSVIGQKRSQMAKRLFKAAGEALAGVKEIKLLGREPIFIERYAKPTRRFTRYMANQQAIRLLPRYALESIAFGGLILIVIYLLVQGQGMEGILPVLGLYGFASYRLMPALQNIFAAMTSMRFSIAALEVIYRDIQGELPDPGTPREQVEPLPFRERLELRGITYSYPGAERKVLEDFDITIQANTSVAFVGSTGSGKTTTVDIVLGLLTPQRGSLVVDGVEVTKDNLARWQKNLGYVPQNIYLSDDSIANNIAFGVPQAEIDVEAVKRAARLANIHDFITRELPEGYATVVGERGVRLSGGQRQRLGIARALYHNPGVLVLDEATSALDSVTEEGIFAAVNEIGRSKTIIMIAHRVTTVRACDVIYLLDQGRIVARGTFEELLASSARFRALAHFDVDRSFSGTLQVS